MLNNKIEDILFLDIETVPAFPTYDEQDERIRKLWDKKSKQIQKNDSDQPEDLYQRAGIYAEFGKIVCISVAYFYNSQLRIKSFYGHDEKKLLLEFKVLVENYFNSSNHLICGHNAKEFDIPYIARRMLINKVKLPAILSISGKKPWEVKHLDTLHLWKFGDYKHYTSLDLLAAVFDIPTPKDDIDGSKVWEVYWVEDNLERIKTYCEKDTVTVVRLYQSLCGDAYIMDKDIVFC